MSQVAPTLTTLPELEPFRDGFTVRAVIGAFFIALVMVPAAIYMSLLLGGGAAGTLTSAADWVTVILFLELARRSFQKLTRQEIVVLLYVAGNVGTAAGVAGLSGGVFANLVWQSYLKTAPATEAFGLHAPGALPNWVAPAADVIARRNIWEFGWNAWGPAIAVLMISYVLNKVQGFVCGYLAFRLTSDIERLEFPMAPVAAQGAMALAEHSGRTESWRWNVFSVGAAIGASFGIVYTLIPSVTGTFLAAPIKVLPIPFLDLSKAVESFMPATALVFSLDLGIILIGMIIPWRVLLGTVAGTVLFQLILNPFVFSPLGLLPKATGMKGQSALKIAQSNYFDLYLSSSLGCSIAIAAAGVIGLVWVVSRRRKRRMEGGEEVARFTPPPGRGDFPIKVMIGVFLASAVGYIALCHVLVPSFPWWIFAAFALVYTPMVTFITARMQGITGQHVGFPMVREGTFFLSGYERPDVWFAPIPLNDFGGGAQFFRQLELTRTKFTSMLKAELLVLPIMLLSSFLFWSYIWKLDPIPSEKYASIQQYWPVNAQTSALWATAKSGGVSWIIMAIKWPIIVVFAVVVLLLIGGASMLGISTEYVYGFVSGSSTGVVQILFPAFLGAVLGRYVLARKFGAENWKRYIPVLIAGYACGAGLIGMLGMAIVFLQRSVSALPY